MTVWPVRASRSCTVSLLRFRVCLTSSTSWPLQWRRCWPCPSRTAWWGWGHGLSTRPVCPNQTHLLQSATANSWWLCATLVVLQTELHCAVCHHSCCQHRGWLCRLFRLLSQCSTFWQDVERRWTFSFQVRHLSPCLSSYSATNNFQPPRVPSCRYAIWPGWPVFRAQVTHPTSWQSWVRMSSLSGIHTCEWPLWVCLPWCSGLPLP